MIRMRMFLSMLHMFVYIHIISIYIYIWREREIEYCSNCAYAEGWIQRSFRFVRFDSLDASSVLPDSRSSSSSPMQKSTCMTGGIWWNKMIKSSRHWLKQLRSWMSWECQHHWSLTFRLGRIWHSVSTRLLRLPPSIRLLGTSLPSQRCPAMHQTQSQKGWTDDPHQLLNLNPQSSDPFFLRGAKQLHWSAPLITRAQ